MKSLADISGLIRPKLAIVAWAVVIATALLWPVAAAAQTCPPQFSWEWSNPLPQGNSVRDISGVGGEYFAVGNVGAALHYNGMEWQRMDTGTVNTLYGVWAASANDVFAVGLTGTIIHWDGYEWTSMTSGTGATLYGVWGGASNDVFAVGTNGCCTTMDSPGHR
jgi:hypothetical protein